MKSFQEQKVLGELTKSWVFQGGIKHGYAQNSPTGLEGPAGWDDAHGKGKEGMSCSKREEGCSAHPETFMCCATIGIVVGSTNRQL